MNGKMSQWLFGCVVCLSFALVATGGFAMEGVALWVMTGLIGVLAVAKFGKQGVNLEEPPNWWRFYVNWRVKGETAMCNMTFKELLFKGLAMLTCMVCPIADTVSGFRSKKRNGEAGFTLIELCVVMAAIFSGTLAVDIYTYRNDSPTHEALAEAFLHYPTSSWKTYQEPQLLADHLKDKYMKSGTLTTIINSDTIQEIEYVPGGGSCGTGLSTAAIYGGGFIIRLKNGIPDGQCGHDGTELYFAKVLDITGTTWRIIGNPPNVTIDSVSNPSVLCFLPTWQDMFLTCPPAKAVKTGINFCIKGKSTGVNYSWKIKTASGQTYENLDAPGVFPVGSPNTDLASELADEIALSDYGTSPSYNNGGCFAFADGDPVEYLWVGKPTNPNCSVENSIGCSYNPTIRAVKSSPDTTLSVSQTSHDIDGTSDTITIDVTNIGTGTGPMGWVAETNDSWLTIESGDYGENSGTITVRYDANSGEERTGTITVVAPGAENSPQTVEVRQTGAAASCEARLTLPTNAYACPDTSVSIPLSIDEFSPWLSAAYNLTAQSDLRNAYTAAVSYFLFDDPGGTLTVAGLESNGYRASEDVRLEIISGKESSMKMTAYHTCGDKLYSVGINGPPFTETVTPGYGGIEAIDIRIGFDETVLTPTGVTLAGGILDGSGYMLTHDAAGGVLTVSVADTQGVNSTDSGVFAYLHFDVVGKEGDTTNLTFASADINNIAVGTVAGLFEANCETSPALSVAPLYHDVPETGGTSTFAVVNTGTGAMNWTATSDASWLTIDSGDSGTDSGTITVNYEVNSGEARTGTITVTAPGAENSPQTVEVRQAACETHFTITASAETGGTISPSGDVTVACGEDRKFTITPDTGYKVEDVLIDGSSVGSVTSHTFTNTASAHTIEAVFAADTFTVNFTVKGNGMLTGEASQSVEYGKNSTGMTAVPNESYKFTGWSGDHSGTANPLIVENVTSDMNIIANFARHFELSDAILILDALTVANADGVSLELDANGDGKVGMEDVVYILQIVAEIRSQ
ncbi:BACON domain-containing carbohydrate-binding protein [Desulfococcaceae bacterium HSG7]|nr:BACON domain-containing carbohydrate-binding protein [Desulfococcaceae bacterium HSG7]